jgi:hypothetical protein
MRFQTLKVYLLNFFHGFGIGLISVIVVLLLLLMFSLGFLDKPVFQAKLKGKVETCGYYLASKYAYSNSITCRAKLENDLVVYFPSSFIKKAGEEVMYAEYERPFTHMTKYVQLF